MKKTLSKVLTGVVAVAFSSVLWSCEAENPFSEQDGMGEVRLRTVVNSIMTRADEADDSQKALKDSCVVYISEAGKGLRYKYKGLDNVPESIKLKTGDYVAEAWTGDSVSASYDKKFYRGYKPFSVTQGSSENVVVNCSIQNVVVSINTSESSALSSNLMQLDSYIVTVKSKKGWLEFTHENAETAKGYFMLSNKDKETQGGPELYVNISGLRKDGGTFSKNDTIKNVKPSHHYRLNFAYTQPDASSDSDLGATFIRINIVDEGNANETETVKGPPSLTGIDFDIEKQIDGTEESVAEHIVKVCGFGELKELYVTSQSSELNLPTNACNLLSATEENLRPYREAGLTWEGPTYKESTGISTVFLTFSSEMLSRLEAKPDEHSIDIRVKDRQGMVTTGQLRIARSAAAIKIEDVIVFDKIDPSDLMAVRARRATLTYALADTYEGVPGVEYRKKGSSDEWTFVAIPASASKPRKATRAEAQKHQMTLTGLYPGTTYEYRGACANWSDNKIYTFTTEDIFSIPNASFENWSSYSASTLLGTKTVIIPWSEGNKSASFWGSGNEGSATANMTLTDKSTDMKHSGTYSARLESKSAMGVIAAGNIFVGEYVKTDGTNGVLSVGREYNGSHPSSLNVYANYRPASGVNVKSGNESFLPQGFAGGNDHGQIYVALTTSAVEIRTNPSNRKLFNRDDPEVIAYGQVSWEGTGFGPDGQLQLVNIPLEYKEDKVKTTKPTHLVIVCSASKYGDYFSGAAGSVMYLDDFELVYE